MVRSSMTYRDEIEEIAIMKNLKHENIVHLHEVIDDQKRRKIYLIQELVEGWSRDLSVAFK
jgi:[calcium/calmodulin-dependent protein kinase] kinase